ncbi:MAG: class I SAM-dependent methyltransferase [Chlorobia bacterium]|nr:class I SAM-dependent methyltransferase [Fimbriimonadaceae bacterium]
METDHTSYQFAERMFGLGGVLDYLQCHECGAMRICDPPSSMADCYPDDYYANADPYTLNYEKGLKWRLLRARDRYEWTGVGGVGKLFSKLKANPRPRSLWPAKLRKTDRILDVGCGSGYHLRHLHSLGFSNLMGIDLFIGEEVSLRGLQLKRQDIYAVQGQFDVVMLNHSLEHMLEHGEVLRECYRLLSPTGRVLVRIPTIECEAWEEYGKDWFQIDAPRHFLLHSRKSISRIAEKAGFQVLAMVDDSTEDQFIFSEIYREGLPMVSRNPETEAKISELRSKMPIEEYKQRAARLNEEGRGDQICVVLSKAV